MTERRREGHMMPEGADFDAWVEVQDLSANDKGELIKFSKYLSIEAAKREHGDTAGICATMQALIYPEPVDDADDTRGAS